MNKIECEVVRDLMPLVKDDIASVNSKELVSEHIKTCKECKQEYDLLEQTEENVKVDEKIEERFIRNIRSNMNVVKTLFVLICIGIVLATTKGTSMFENILIMPCVGVITKILYKKHWYVVPSVVFLTELFYRIYEYGREDGLRFEGYITFGLIYVLFIIIGMIITSLIKYIFKKEND